MKRKLLIAFIALVCAALCAFGLAACGIFGGNNQGGNNGEQGNNQQGNNQNGEHIHTYGEWTVVTPATCTQEGERQRACSCGDKQSETIPALGHDYVDGVCTRCSEKDPDYIPPSEGLEFTLSEDGTYYAVTGLGECKETVLVFPATYNGKPVKRVGYTEAEVMELVKNVDINNVYNAEKLALKISFVYKRDITKVIIPNGVIEIGCGAFVGMMNYNDYVHGNSLTSVTIGNSVTSIGRVAFSGCNSLTSITIPDGVTSINYATFAYCRGLTSITIPNNVTSIGDWAFEDCSSLTSITIGNGVTSIGDYAFSDCSSLTSITIPDSVTSIGEEAFYHCDSLTSIEVEKGNTKYHSAGNCLIETETKTLILGCKNSFIPNDNSVTSIGSHAFYGCSSLTSINIPDSVTSIDNAAFYNCSKLTDIHFNGTKAQWNAIKKSSNWNSYTGNYTVHCTDGDITK